MGVKVVRVHTWWIVGQAVIVINRMDELRDKL